MPDPVTPCDVSVLIATRHRPQSLQTTLESLAAMNVAGLSWNVVVIDNGNDRETELVAERFASRLPLRLLVEPKPGKNRALNRGLEIASPFTKPEGLIAFTDDDVTVDEGWLRELWEGAGRWPDGSMFGGRILPRWPDGGEPRRHPFFDHAYGIADFTHPEGRYSAGYVYGANMAIRGKIFRGGWRFDERIGPDGTDRYITGSETSLTVALQRSGHHAVYLPGAVVHHHIRREQLTPQWIYGRAFRRGRADARKRELTGGIRALPRELLVEAGLKYLQWLGCRLRGDGDGALERGIEYWTVRGMIYHCRVTEKADDRQPRATPSSGTRTSTGV